MATNELLDRLPDLHLDPTAPEPVINGVAFRSSPALPVEFTAACPRRHGDMTDIADVCLPRRCSWVPVRRSATPTSASFCLGR
jgi:hypothetical protein